MEEWTGKSAVPRLQLEKHLLDLFSPVEYLGDGQRGLDGPNLIPKFSWNISTYDVSGSYWSIPRINFNFIYAR
jgi:hypothetical protein